MTNICGGRAGCCNGECITCEKGSLYSSDELKYFRPDLLGTEFKPEMLKELFKACAAYIHEPNENTFENFKNIYVLSIKKGT